MRLIDYYGADGWGAEHAAHRGMLLHRQVVARDLIAGVIDRLPGDEITLVDVGCGDGSFVDHLARHLADPRITYHGLDYSPHQVAAARALPYRFDVCDLGDGIPLPDASVDLVHAAEVIEHLYDPDLLLEECARVLRPGGHVVLSTPNLQAWFNRLLFVAGIQPIFYESSSRSTEVGAGALRRLKRYTQPVGHLRLFNRTALLDLLRREGFTPVTLRGARYHDVPKALAGLDRAFCARPSMASVLVVDAVKAAAAESAR